MRKAGGNPYGTSKYTAFANLIVAVVSERQPDDEIASRYGGGLAPAP